MLACPAPASDDTGDSDTDTDTDADSDTDTDTDSDTDTDVDTDTSPPDLCAEEPATPAPGSDPTLDPIYTAQLQCGETYHHTLTGAPDNFDHTGDYTSCYGIYGSVFPNEYVGPDCLYFFEAPAGASVTVDTPCDWLAVRFRATDDKMNFDPDEGFCETDSDSPYPPYSMPDMGPNGIRIAVIVDTFNGIGGAYTITVGCP